jgi:hypothetical protein
MRRVRGDDKVSCAAGERIFDFFTPGAMGHHIVFFTFAMMFVCFIVFFYMVGSYPLYVLQTDSSVSTCLSALNTPSGRQLFVDWMFPGVSADQAQPALRAHTPAGNALRRTIRVSITSSWQG